MNQFVQKQKRKLLADRLLGMYQMWSDEQDILQYFQSTDLEELISTLKKKRKSHLNNETMCIASIMLEDYVQNRNNIDPMGHAITLLIELGVPYKLFLKDSDLKEDIRSKDDLLEYIRDRPELVEDPSIKVYREFRSKLLRKINELYTLDETRISIEDIQEMEERNWLEDILLKDLLKFVRKSNTHE